MSTTELSYNTRNSLGTIVVCLVCLSIFKNMIFALVETLGPAFRNCKKKIDEKKRNALLLALEWDHTVAAESLLTMINRLEQQDQAEILKQAHQTVSQQ